MLKIVFMGTPSFSVPILEALHLKYQIVGVVTQPDKPVNRNKHLSISPVKEYALKHNLPLFQPEKIRQQYEDIMALNPDLIVSAAYGQIVGMKLLNHPKYRSINVHGSLLPKYRGGAPIQYAILNGDTETGITIMYMENKMDAGDILTMRKIPIEDDDTTGSLFDNLSLLGRDLLMETIPKLINNEIVPQAQDQSHVTFAYNITPELEKLDLNKDAKTLFNQIRALLPQPVAHLYLNEHPESKIKVYKACVSNQTHNEKNGTIINIAKNYFTIAVGAGTALDIYQLAPIGKRMMDARDFINGGLKKYLK